MKVVKPGKRPKTQPDTKWTYVECGRVVMLSDKDPQPKRAHGALWLPCPTCRKTEQVKYGGRTR